MDVFVARQPIFNPRQEVVAYELLFRSSLENVFRCTDPDHASSRVIADSALTLGLETLTGGKKAFINVTRNVLLWQLPTLLPPDQTVVEILETVEPDPEVVEACRQLKQQGYTLALDDFVYEEAYQALLPLVDIIKVDFLASPPETRREIVSQLHSLGIQFLAEKVEDQKAFEEARAQGYTLFQGFFFSRPVILSAQEIPAFKIHLLRILQEIHRPSLDLLGLEALIKQEVSFAYKLLRYINAPFFPWRRRVESIRQALVLLGEQEVRKWATMVAMAGMGEDRPQELVVQSVVRARFCESLAPWIRMGARSQDLFLLGMFSLLDALVGRPLEELLARIPLAEDLQEALLRRRGTLGQVLTLALAYEEAQWERARGVAQALSIPEEVIPECYLKAVEWANQSFHLHGPLAPEGSPA